MTVDNAPTPGNNDFYDQILFGGLSGVDPRDALRAFSTPWDPNPGELISLHQLATRCLVPILLMGRQIARPLLPGQQPAVGPGEANVFRVMAEIVTFPDALPPNAPDPITNHNSMRDAIFDWRDWFMGGGDMLLLQSDPRATRTLRRQAWYDWLASIPGDGTITTFGDHVYRSAHAAVVETAATLFWLWNAARASLGPDDPSGTDDLLARWAAIDWPTAVRDIRETLQNEFASCAAQVGIAPQSFVRDPVVDIAVKKSAAAVLLKVDWLDAAEAERLVGLPAYLAWRPVSGGDGTAFNMIFRFESLPANFVALLVAIQAELAKAIGEDVDIRIVEAGERVGEAERLQLRLMLQQMQTFLDEVRSDDENWLNNTLARFVIDEMMNASRAESAHTSPVMLRGRNRAPSVLGHDQPLLSDAQFDVIEALLQAGNASLSGPDLVDKSGHTDAVNVLKGLAKEYPDSWGQVIYLPGRSGPRGYRIISTTHS